MRGHAIHGNGTDDGAELRATAQRDVDEQRTITGDRYQTMSERDIAFLSHRHTDVILLENVYCKRCKLLFSGSLSDVEYAGDADDRDAGKRADRLRQQQRHHDATDR